jgi:RNA polymerase sigma factor (sigma-70 family)
MDHDQLVRRATGGDMQAFVELTRRFQHFAFGTALALVHDFQKAEDVVQDAFMAAWSALPSLADPKAFPAWLRGIVRHHAFRVLRRKDLEVAPLADADRVASEEAAPDHRLEQRQRAAAVMASMADLPDGLREPAMLFFVHECSHQDIANFLGLSVATVNNRVHAARTKLKRRMLTMVAETLQAHALPDDFANRIGRLIEARGNVVDILFDPNAMPDILSELALSDEVNRRAVSVQVVQRPGPGIVRGIAGSPIDGLRRGSTVLSSGHQSEAPVNLNDFGRIVPLLAGPSPIATGAGKLLETGIKVIDVMCPLVAGGSVVIAGEARVGVVVVAEELVRRLCGSNERVSLFPLVPLSPNLPPGSWRCGSFAADLKQESGNEGTVGPVQTFFLRAEDAPWTSERLEALTAADVVIHLSRERIQAKVYPAVDALTSCSRLLETKAVGEEHVATAERVRHALAALWADRGRSQSDTNDLMLERALKLQNYFTQPFYIAEPYTKRPGATVSVTEALRTCRDILDGRYDAVPVEAFYFKGGIAEIEANPVSGHTIGPVTLQSQPAEKSL